MTNTDFVTRSPKTQRETTVDFPAVVELAAPQAGFAEGFIRVAVPAQFQEYLARLEARGASQVVLRCTFHDPIPWTGEKAEEP